MNALLRMLMKPVVRPLARLLVGLLAIPAFRFLMRKVARDKEMDEELEKDLEQWFRGALVLLVATKNMEEQLFDWALAPATPGMEPILFFFRLSLAIAVIEFMPDQELFAIIHANPPRLHWKNGVWTELKAKWRPFLKGLLGQQVNRYAPVFAILSVAFDGWIGWTAYLIAIVLYLLIGLVTSRDKALDVLGEFDQQVAMRRQELIEEYHLEDRPPDFTPVGSLPEGEAVDDAEGGPDPPPRSTAGTSADDGVDHELPDFGPSAEEVNDRREADSE